MEMLVWMATVVGCIVAGIIILSLFFKLLALWNREIVVRPLRVTFKGLFDDKTPARVRLTNGTVLESVKFVGITNSAGSDGAVPYEMSGWIILEHADGCRSIVPARRIALIETLAPATGA